MNANRMIPSIFCALAALGIPALSPASGADTLTEDSLTSPALLRFGAPDIYKVGPQTAHLQAGDLNGDGLRDLICADNQKNLLYLLFQEEEGERPFKVVEESAETAIGSLAVGDLNGDGKDDLALGGTQAFVRLQTEHGTLADSRELEEAGNHALIADLDNDGRRDLLLVGESETFLLRQTESGGLAAPERRVRAFKMAWKPLLFDLNGDGRLDLACRDAETPDQLIVAFQNASGGFGAEIAFEAGLLFYLDGASALGAGGPGIVATENNTHALKVMRLAPRAPSGEEDAEFSLMRVLPYADEKSPANARTSLAIAELEPNSPPVIFVLGEQRAAVDILRAGPDAALTRETRPSLLGPRKMRLTRDNNGTHVWLLSREEGAIGVANVEEGRIGFPQPLELDGRPLAFDMADMDGSGADDLVYLSKIDSAVHLRVLADPDLAALDKASRMDVDLDAIGGKAFKDIEPEDLTAADFNNDGLCDVAIFLKYGEMQVLLQSEKGQFKPLLGDEGVKKGMFEGVDAGQFLPVDFLGDKGLEILVARSTFVRVLSLKPGGEMQILHQLNGKSGASRIAAVAAGDVDGDGVLEALLLDKGAKAISIYKRNADGEYDVLKHIDLKAFVGQSLLAGDLNGDGRDDIIAGGTDKLGVIFSGRPDPALQDAASRRTEVEDGGYRLAVAGDLMSAPGDEIAVLENKEHLLEFYQLDKDDALQRIYKFKVFGGEGESAFYNPDAPRPPEPSEVIFPDINGDGRNDLAILVHDKVIVYLQIDPGEPESGAMRGQ